MSVANQFHRIAEDISMLTKVSDALQTSENHNHHHHPATHPPNSPVLTLRKKLYRPPNTSDIQLFLPRKQMHKFDSHQGAMIVRQRLKPKVLIVDDNRFAAYGCQRACELHGCIGTVATNSQDALLLLEERVFDFMITDLRLGPHSGMDGIDLSARVREIETATGVRIPIILSIALEDDQDAAIFERALDADIDRYVLKPTVHQVGAICDTFLAGGTCSEMFRRMVDEEGLAAHFSDMCDVFDTELIDSDETRGYIELLQKERRELEAKNQHVVTRLTDRIKKLQETVHDLQYNQRPRTPMEEKIAIAMERWKASSGQNEVQKQNTELKKRIEGMEELINQYRLNIKSLIQNGGKLYPAGDRRNSNNNRGGSRRASIAESFAGSRRGSRNGGNKNPGANPCPLGSRELYEEVCMEFEDFASSRLWHNYPCALTPGTMSTKHPIDDLMPSLGSSWFTYEMRSLRDYVASKFVDKYFKSVEDNYTYLRGRAGMIREDSFKAVVTDTLMTLSTNLETLEDEAKVEITALINNIVRREMALWRNIFSGKAEAVAEFVPQLFRPETYKVNTASKGTMTEVEEPKARTAEEEAGDSTFLTTESPSQTREINNLKEELKRANSVVHIRTLGLHQSLMELAQRHNWSVDALKATAPSFATDPSNILKESITYMVAAAETMKQWKTVPVEIMPNPPIDPGSKPSSRQHPPSRGLTSYPPPQTLISLEGMEEFPLGPASPLKSVGFLGTTSSSKRLGRTGTADGPPNAVVVASVSDAPAWGASNNKAGGMTKSVASIQGGGNEGERYDRSFARSGYIAPMIINFTESDLRQHDGISNRIDTLLDTLTSEKVQKNEKESAQMDLKRAKEDKAYLLITEAFKKLFPQQREVNMSHTCIQGESLQSIAESYHCNPEELMKLNPHVLGLKDTLQQGTEVVVPLSVTQIGNLMGAIHRRYIVPNADVTVEASGGIAYSIEEVKRICLWYERNANHYPTSVTPSDRVVQAVLHSLCFAGGGGGSSGSEVTLEHVVHDSDSLKSLSQNYVVDMDAIRAANPFLAFPARTDKSLKGIEALTIPVSNAAMLAAKETILLAPQPASFETSQNSSKLREMKQRQLSERDGKIVIGILEKEAARERERSTMENLNIGHVVEHGDSVRSIARLYTTSVENILLANPVLKKDEVKLGAPLDGRKYLGVVVPVPLANVVKSLEMDKAVNTEKLIQSIHSAAHTQQQQQKQQQMDSTDVPIPPASPEADRTTFAVLAQQKQYRTAVANDTILLALMDYAKKNLKIPILIAVEHHRLLKEELNDLVVAYDVSASSIRITSPEIATVQVRVIPFYERLCEMRNKAAASVFEVTNKSSSRYTFINKQTEQLLMTRRTELMRLQTLTSYLERAFASQIHIHRNRVLETVQITKRAVVMHSLLDHILRTYQPPQATKLLVSLHQACKHEEWYVLRDFLLMSSFGGANTLLETLEPSKENLAGYGATAMRRISRVAMGPMDASPPGSPGGAYVNNNTNTNEAGTARIQIVQPHHRGKTPIGPSRGGGTGGLGVLGNLPPPPPPPPQQPASSKHIDPSGVRTSTSFLPIIPSAQQQPPPPTTKFAVPHRGVSNPPTSTTKAQEALLKGMLNNNQAMRGGGGVGGTITPGGGFVINKPQDSHDAVHFPAVPEKPLPPFRRARGL
eukprot:PhF_6_TR10376/c0_g1_i2/m.16150